MLSADYILCYQLITIYGISLNMLRIVDLSSTALDRFLFNKYCNEKKLYKRKQFTTFYPFPFTTNKVVNNQLEEEKFSHLFKLLFILKFGLQCTVPVTVSK
jgi:hypothetical protein